MKNGKKSRTIRYAEPAGFFPEEIRKKYQLGEYAETPPEKPDGTPEKKVGKTSE